jgi:N-acetylneuraminic acid mutarotase
MGGEGLTNKKNSILLNDIWAFELRSNSWSELVIENRTSFRPRANFTANHHKNTIYVFGGFINLSNFRCTD